MDVELRAPRVGEVEVVAELKAVVMRDDLERLGRYDEVRVRQRLRDEFSEVYSSVIVRGEDIVGSLTVRPYGGGLKVEHLYLDPRHQGRGIGSRVLREVLARADAEGVDVRLTVLRGSAVRGLYERYGFVVEDEDPIDVHMVRVPAASA
ncbi:GNAT family N-acetyltransferase [Streptomyces sp. NBC_00503]|uniref:GNAT family N-acetyltransferase n=1 Tax=Streptomyces sp. NBC_00503 TaxID=2903659 RepID=UPI002E7FE3FD|nr:GNAT family N-acetyltransferase [Streptomyces sp. NBC_00503]WUD80836.1 GNAT family N-acetyltransferase [Streptomyces sp. NBC_00503]